MDREEEAPSGYRTCFPHTRGDGPPEDLRERYSAETWHEFEQWAKELTIMGVRESGGDKDSSVWDWLARKVQNALYQPDGSAIRKAPVRGAITGPTRGPLQKIAARALDAVDKVHDDGQLPPIRLDSKTGRNALGEFEHYLTGGSVRIGIRNSGPWPHLTACHELGHFLDYGAFGENQGFASEQSPLFAAFRHAVNSSKAVASLRSSSVLKPKAKEYLLSHKELWARAYAQWIAQSSGDKVLLKERDAVRKQDVVPDRQWTDSDFEPIAKAIGEIFKAKGWI